MLNLILVIIGIVIFGYSLYLHVRFLGLVKKTLLGKWWAMLLALVLFFALGYIVFAYWLVAGTEIFSINFLKTLVSFIFFFGAIFVVISISIIYSTVRDSMKERGSLENKVKERTAELEQLKNNLEKIVAQKTEELNKTVMGLKKGEERFRQVAEGAEEWIWEVDKEGLYTYASPVIERILGYKPEEIVGKKHFYDLFTPDVREDLKKAALAAFAKKETFKNFLNPNIHKNGDIVLLETSGSPVLDEKGNLLGYRGADMDVTARKKTEEELKNRAEELEQANKLMVGRELRMAEMRKEIDELKKRLGET